MKSDLVHALCALAAFFIPLGFAWFVVSRTARRHPHSHHTTARDPRKDRPMR
jgi:hypothetical protein